MDPSNHASEGASGSAKPVVVEAITRLNIGGPARHVLSAASGLGDRYAMRVVTGTAPEVEGEFTAPGLTLDRLPMVRSVSPTRDVTALAGMRRLLRGNRVDLVHSHMAKAGSVARLAAASMRRPPKTIHTFHGHVLAGYFSPRAEHVFAHVERYLARRSDLLIAVSEEVRDALLELGIGDRAQYEVVPLGVELEPYLAVEQRSGRLRESLGIADDVPLVAVVARLTPIKDHATLLGALNQLPGVHLAVIGDGELRPALTAQARALGMAERVHFLGWRHELPELLADVDVAALTSRNEGTPMALIEASAAGLPVVATEVGGVPRVVVDRHTGLLVRPGDVDNIAEAVRRLLDDPVVRVWMGERGRKHVVRNFGMQGSLERLAALYDEVLAR